MKRITAGALTLMTTAGWADDWECKQLRDVIVSPPTWIKKKPMSHLPLMSVAPKSRYCLRPFRFFSAALRVADNRFLRRTFSSRARTRVQDLEFQQLSFRATYR